MTSDIVLIGPVRAGKSTLANLLAERLSLPRVSLDQHRWRYFADAGYDRARARNIQASEGYAGLYRYKKPFEAKALIRLLGEFSGCVFDLAASQSVYENDALFAQVSAALAPYENVVLVLPSPDPKTTVAVLKERTGGLSSSGIDFIEHFVKHPSNQELAKITVHTHGRTPDQTASEILRRAGLERTSTVPPPAPRAGPPPRTTPRRRVTSSGTIGATARDAGEDTLEPEIDRSSFAQHRQLVEARLPGLRRVQAELERVRDERRRAELERVKLVLDRPLPEFARCFVNECVAEVDAAVEAALGDATGGSPHDVDARARASRLYARRLPLSATLRSVLALDPRHGVIPTHDGATLALLRHAEVAARVRTAQRDTLHDRFLRIPQRSRYPFLHEVITGWLANVIGCGGALKQRRQLRLSDTAGTQLPAYFVSAMARTHGRSAAQMAALHFADNDVIEDVLSQATLDLLLVSAELVSLLEPLMVHVWGEAPRRVVGDVLLFFSIPSLERMLAQGASRPLSLSPEAGWQLEQRFTEAIGSPPAADANEADVAGLLRGLVDDVWCDAHAERALSAIRRGRVAHAPTAGRQARLP